jgi:hypothetical protein
MPKQKLDGVVQAVHYTPDGQVEWVRAYLRRGPTFSDRVQLDRQTLVANLKAGKRYFAGQPVPRMASTFQLSEPLQILEKEGRVVLVTGNRRADRDRLDGVPVI